MKKILIALIFIILFNYKVEGKEISKRNEMIENLDLCWDIFKEENIEFSKKYYNKYFESQKNIPEVWNEYRKKIRPKYTYYYRQRNSGVISFLSKDYRIKTSITFGSFIEFCDSNMKKSFKRLEENEYAKSIGFSKGILGYSEKLYNIDLLLTILSVNYKPSLLKEVKKYLIKKGKSEFVLEDILKDYVIYSTFTKKGELIKFALKKKHNKIYLQNSRLEVEYFSLIGTKRFEKVIGEGSVDILVFKEII